MEGIEIPTFVLGETASQSKIEHILIKTVNTFLEIYMITLKSIVQENSKISSKFCMLGPVVLHLLIKNARYHVDQ